MLRLQSLLFRSTSLIPSSIVSSRITPFVVRRGYATDDTFKTLLEEISSSIKPKESSRTQENREDRGNNGERDFGSSRFGDRNGGDRNGGDRSFSRSYGDRNGGDRGYGNRGGDRDSYGDRSSFGGRGDRSGSRFGDRNGGDRYGDRNGGDRYGDRAERRGGFGGDQGGRRDFGDRNSGPMNFGNKLNSVDWKNTELSTVNKNFYKEHEEVKAMSQGDAAAWRQQHTITIKGAGCPNPVVSFDHIPFSPEIVKLLKTNYQAPTPIQAQGWPLALSGKDMVGSSQTGSGKTLGFVLPAIAHIAEQIKHQPLKWSDGPIALVLAPTRELAVQIIAESNAYIRKMGMRATAVYGGSHKGGQVQQLREGVHLLVATPGRLIDFLSDQTTNLKRVSYVVLDEADRMLDMGFEPQIRQIMSQLRPDRQTLMWSATWPNKVQALAYEFFSEPITIHVGSTELRANPNVTQNFHILSERDKHDKVRNLVDDLHKEGPTKTLVFCGTQEMADRLCYSLQDSGYRQTASIHGGKSQQQRMHLLSSFKDGNLHILVATDVAARGLDINNIQHVINYDFPNEIEDYIHRIGRTGRAGKTGTSHTFLTHEKHPGKNASHLLRVLQDAGQKISDELRAFSMGGGFNNNNNDRYNRPRRFFGRR